MRFLVKNKFISFGEGSRVFDEKNEIAFVVKGNMFSNMLWGRHKKCVCDKNKNKLFFVRNKFWHLPFFRSAVIFDSNKNKLATVTNSHVIKNGYEVVGATEPISVEGRWWDLDIKLGEKHIGHVSLPEIKSAKDFFRVVDAYVLDVEDEEDVGFLVALVIAIDNICDQRRQNR